jgi:hypothetical protein
MDNVAFLFTEKKNYFRKLKKQTKKRKIPQQEKE